MESEEAIQEQLRYLSQQTELLNQKLTQIREKKSTSLRNEENPKPSTSAQENIASDSITTNSNTRSGFATYQKLAGTRDVGREYEQVMCAYYALKLATNDEVKDFGMTSNNKKDGKFDDIGVKVNFTNGESRRFLFQLKHKEGKSINLTDLMSESKNNDFGVKKYIESMEKMTLDEDTVCILSTNCSTKMQGKIELTNGISFEQCNYFKFEEFLVNTKEGCQNATFEVKLESLKQKFYFFTSQLNAKATEEEVNALLKNLLQCEIYDAFKTYMGNWWSGRFVLTKHDIIWKISELAFSPYLRVLTDNKCNEKTEFLKEAIMNFPLTIVEDCGEDIVENIWKVEESWVDEDFSKARSKYGLKDYQTSTTFWYLGKFPLVVKLDRSNERVIKCVMNFLRKDVGDKKIVLIGEVSKDDFGNWTSLRSLWDVTNCEENQHKLEIMQTFHISLQGRGCIALENLVKSDSDVAKLFGTRELLQMTQEEHFLVGNEKDKLPDLHIPRFVFSITSTGRAEAVKETEIFKYFKNPVHLFCAPPGMGKSTLMQVLYNSCPSDCLAVYVSLINYNSVLATQPDDDTILTHFLGTEATESNLFEQLKKQFWQKRKLYLFLDGLDEVNSQHVECILNFVKQASSQGVNIWLSSRENLREKIRQTLKAVTIGIKELSKEERHEYINNKLKISYTSEEIEKIVLAMFSSTDLNKSQNLLGIPLQLHIVTELFVNDRQVYENLEKKNLFVLTQMYKIYFEGKIKFTINKLVDQNQEQQLGYVRHILQAYEYLAVKSCLHPLDYQRLSTKASEDKDFLNELKTEGDKHGIIKIINAYDEVIFNHQSYAEYFAATWFKKNTDKIRLLQDRIFSPEYEHLRLLFDVMLAENNPLHLAIIYQDINQLENHIGDIDSRDNGGRTVFHVAFSYGQKYDPSRYIADNHFFFDQMTRETSSYVKMIERLLQEGKLPQDRDDIFGLDCVSYALQARCLYPIEKILEKKLFNFEKLEEVLYKFYKQEAVVYWCAKFGYPNLLSECIKKYQHNLKVLIKLAIIGCQGDASPTTEKNVEVVRMLIENGAPLCNILGTACSYKRFNMLEVLIKNGAKCKYGKTILHDLVQYLSEKHSDEIVSAIKKFDICVNARDDFDATALQYAAEGADSKILKILIDNGADLNVTDMFNANLLHYAARNPGAVVYVMKLLLDGGLSVNARDDYGRTALLSALQTGVTENVKLLLDYGADPKVTDNKKDNALHYASKSNRDNSYNILQVLTTGLRVHEQNQDGLTPLHLACERGHLKNVEILLKQGADPNFVDKKGENALHHVVLSHSPEIKEMVQLLIDKGVDVNGKNSEGTTPLHAAATNTDLEIVKMLEENGADFNILDNHRRNILHYASTNHRINVIKLFVKRGISVNAQDQDGIAPLHLASENYNPQIVEILLKQGANPKIMDNDKNNALHYASKTKFFKNYTIELFIMRNLDVNAKNKEGFTPIDFAYMADNLQNVDFLLQRGAKKDVNDKFKNGQTLLHLTCKYEHSEVPTKLLNQGFDPNSRDDDKRDALHYHLLEFYDKELVYQMINHGLNPNTLYEHGQILLHIACLHGDHRSVRELVEKSVDVNALDENRQTPLQVVVKSLKKVKECIFKHLNRRFRYDIGEHEHEYETYKFGCERCYTELRRNLLEHRSYTIFVDYVKHIFFDVVDNNRTVDLFLQHIKDINLEIDVRNTVGCIVTRFIIFEMINYLLENEAVMDNVDRLNKTVIDYASELEEEFPEVIDLLRQYGHLKETNIKSRFSFNWRRILSTHLTGIFLICGQVIILEVWNLQS